MKRIYIIIATILICGAFSSCAEEKLGPSIFDDYEPVELTEFDQWLEENYREQYNIKIIYRWEQYESSLTHNLSPTRQENAELMGKVLKHLWLDAYDEVKGDISFMRELAPRVIFFVGSAALNPEDGTETLGSAEGGLKIILYKLNDFVLPTPGPNFETELDLINENYFKTMHHEFAHILHQKKAYPQQDFNSISAGRYAGTAWVNLEDADAWGRGFVTPYGGSAPQEDFVEVIANYLVKSDAWWANMIANAGDFGAAAITKKLDMATKWMQTKWGINLKELQTIIRRRSEELSSLQ